MERALEWLLHMSYSQGKAEDVVLCVRIYDSHMEKMIFMRCSGYLGNGLVLSCTCWQ